MAMCRKNIFITEIKGLISIGSGYAFHARYEEHTNGRKRRNGEMDVSLRPDIVKVVLIEMQEGKSVNFCAFENDTPSDVSGVKVKYELPGFELGKGDVMEQVAIYLNEMFNLVVSPEEVDQCGEVQESSTTPQRTTYVCYHLSAEEAKKFKHTIHTLNQTWKNESINQQLSWVYMHKYSFASLEISMADLGIIARCVAQPKTYNPSSCSEEDELETSGPEEELVTSEPEE